MQSGFSLFLCVDTLALGEKERRWRKGKHNSGVAPYLQYVGDLASGSTVVGLKYHYTGIYSLLIPLSL